MLRQTQSRGLKTWGVGRPDMQEDLTLINRKVTALLRYHLAPRAAADSYKHQNRSAGVQVVRSHSQTQPFQGNSLWWYTSLGMMVWETSPGLTAATTIPKLSMLRIHQECRVHVNSNITVTEEWVDSFHCLKAPSSLYQWAHCIPGESPAKAPGTRCHICPSNSFQAIFHFSSRPIHAYLRCFRNHQAPTGHIR